MQESDLWIVFVALVVFMLAADMFINRRPRHIPMRSAALQTAVWISVAVAFGILVFFVTGNTDLTLEYYTAYAIEEAMSMDNLFVFIIIFAFFGIRDEDQHKALFYGVAGAIIFRAIFIFAGVELLSMFDWLLYVFGVILLVVAVKTLVSKDDGKENRMARFMKEHFDYVDDSEAEGKLLVKRDGKRVMTAILLCIIVIELTDIVFALDSIPAVLAISTDTLIIYTSNIFAIMGLRSLFFVIKGGMDSLVYLKYGLGAILLFVAAKLLVHEFVEIPVLLSLFVILGVLAVTVAASLLKGRNAKVQRA